MTSRAMSQLTSFSEIKADSPGYLISLLILAVIGARYDELRRRADRSWVQPGSAEAWLDFCRHLSRLVDRTNTWDEWDAGKADLDRAHPTKFTDMTRRVPEQRPTRSMRMTSARGCAP